MQLQPHAAQLLVGGGQQQHIQQGAAAAAAALARRAAWRLGQQQPASWAAAPQLHQHIRAASSASTSTAAAAAKQPVVAYTAVRQENIQEKELHVEASEAYLAYAMSVIVGRALPDVRDGLKPVHRRILYAMHDLGISHSRPYKKCARVVGEVLGKYHPHGDTAVYDALVRMAQDFSMQLPLVSGHGNFGSLDDDPPAAMRYTECRLASAAEDMLLDDLDADTVDFAPTFDAAQDEPLVLPAKVPNLLVNGTQGIAVGIATKIPPHNLGEVVAALEALVQQPDISPRELLAFTPAPDFPTGGELLVTPETAAAYETGHGSVVLRATAHVEYEGSKRKKKHASTLTGSAGAAAAAGAGADTESQAAAAAAAAAGGKALIVFTEMPYQVCKSDLVQRIAEMVDAKQLDGITDVRDESDRTGVRLVVEVKRGFSVQLVLNQLYKSTRLQLRFSTNMVALVGGVPKTLTFKECLQHFLDFREGVVQRRAQHALSKATARLHLVEGLLLALQQLDAVVQAIRAAADGPAAKTALVSRFALSEAQAEGVLAMTLRRLTGLEAGRLREEQQQLTATIRDLQDLLSDRSRVLQVVLEEARSVAAKHGQPRRSRILVQPSADAVEPKEEDVIPNTPSLVTFSSRGYVKRMPVSTWDVQKRGGKGKASGKLRDQDVLDELLSCRAHDTLLLLSAAGRGYGIKAHKVPEASRAAMGTPIAQVLGLPAAERFPTLLAVSDFDAGCLVMATSRGGIKRTALTAFSKLRATGLAAVKLLEGEQLAAGGLAPDRSHVVLASSGGLLAHFPLDTVRQAGRAAGCIKGLKLKAGESLVSMTVLPPELAQQVKAAQEAAKAAEAAKEAAAAAGGDAAAADPAAAADSSAARSRGPWLLMVTRNGTGKRVPLQDVSLKANRGTQGVIGIKLAAGDALAMVQLVHSDEDDVVLASKQGAVMRCAAKDVSVLSRTAKGFRLMSLQPDDEVQTLTILPATYKTALA